VAHTENGSLYAAKIITKAKLSIQDDLALRDEIGALNTLNHNNIIQLYDVFDENDYYYLVTELMCGGDLFDRIVTKVTYNEREARDVCRILFQAIEHCHEYNIAHRDLKPENILLVVSLYALRMYVCTHIYIYAVVRVRVLLSNQINYINQLTYQCIYLFITQNPSFSHSIQCTLTKHAFFNLYL
jgi:serine/threonine protein kinase